MIRVQAGSADVDAGGIGRWVLTVVMPSLATLTVVNRDAQGRVTLRLDGPPARQYTLQASEDLIAWMGLGVLSADPGLNLFTDSDAALRQQRFYRLLEEP